MKAVSPGPSGRLPVPEKIKGTEHSFLLGSWIVFDCDVERPTLGSFLLTVLLIGLVSARDWDLT